MSDRTDFCPLCKSMGIDTGFSFWCSNISCNNFKKKWDNSSEYKKECKCDKDKCSGNCKEDSKKEL